MDERHKNTGSKEKPLLLVAPLDWGLGHTLRLIPLVQYLKHLECRVIVACNSAQKALLAQEIPDLTFVYLEGYNISYGRTRTITLARLLLGSAKILTKVKQEEMWFLRYLAQNRVNAVISDNRYGLQKPGFPSVLITHQLNVHTGFGRIANTFATRIVQRMIHKFSECWIPDVSSSLNLAGTLSQPAIPLKMITRHLGPISRFNKCENRSTSDSVLVILSGPEPQRSIFEQIILSGSGFQKNLTLVRGLPDNDADTLEVPDITVYNYLGTRQLNQLICAAGLVISRSGYTTIMDIVKLKKKLVTVPTPGQGEQEYLSKHLSSAGIAPSINQKDFSFRRAIEEAERFTYRFPVFDMDRYKDVIDNFIASLSSS